MLRIMADIENNKDIETSEKKRVVLDRAISMNIEKIPLSPLPKYKTASPRLLGKWKSYKKKINNENVEDSNDYHFMKRGESPPADDMVLFDSFEDLGGCEALSVKVCRESVRQTLMDLMKSTGSGAHYLEDMEAGKLSSENLKQHFSKSTKMEKNVAFLWSAFIKRLDYLENLFALGVDMNYAEAAEGFTALHLSAFSGCVKCVKFLISKGANINCASKWFTPLHSAAFGNSFEVVKFLLSNGAKFDVSGTSKSNDDFIYGNPLHSAVKANAVECVLLLVAECSNINSVEPCGFSPLHSAAELGHIHALKILLDHGVDPNLITRDKKNTPLHLAAEGGFSECVSVLLSKGADANACNYKGQIPLHLAARAQSVDCAELLLHEGGCDPNAIDNDKRSPLHSAVGKSLLAFEITEALLLWNAKVNHKDKYGYTPLHIAAMNEQARCVETLLYHGADISAKTNGGTTALSIIVRKTPSSLGMLYQKLDNAISLHDPEASNREVELKLDFRYLLQNCHMGEIAFLKTFVDAGQKEVLEHPLCEAFLYLKWEKIRKYYIGRLIFCALFILCLTAFVLMALAHNCYNVGKAMQNQTSMANNEIKEDNELCVDNSMTGYLLRENPRITEIVWFVLVFLALCEAVRKLIGFSAYSSLKQYLSHMENVVEWLVLFSVFAISCIYTGRTYTWQNHVGAFAVLLGWINLMVMIGQLPVLGSYVAMYTSIQKEFAKLFAAYLCVLIGFTFSFCVIFPQSKAFANPFVGFIQVLVMMTGELSFDDLLLGDNENKPAVLLEISAHVIFVLFVLFVTIILMNLLVGIAVHDIQGLQKTAGLYKLVSQTELISYIEAALFAGCLPGYFIKFLQWTALVSPSAYRVVIQVKPLNSREKRLPKNVLKAAYEIAKQRKKCSHTLTSRGSCSTTSFSYIKSRAASFIDNQKNAFPQMFDSVNIQTLITEVEQSLKAVSEVRGELLELREATKHNQIMLNRILDLLSKKCSDC